METLIKRQPRSDEVKLRISMAMLGRSLTEEHKNNISKSMKEKNTWSYGSTFSDETRKKLSLSHVGMTGKKHSTESREKIRRNRLGKLTGRNNPMWRGGITSTNRIIRESPKYQEWRLKVFTRDKWTCVECGKKGGTIHADHIKQFAYFPELRFDIDNGRTLCVSCHRETDTWGKKINNKNI